MKYGEIFPVLLLLLVIGNFQCSSTPNCPNKRVSGCTIVTVVQPHCRHNYVFPQTEYKAAVDINTCIPRHLLHIYWILRSNGRIFSPLKCRQRLTCSIQANEVQGSSFTMEALVFILNTDGTRKLQSILIPILYTKLSLSTLLDLVKRKQMKVADALKMTEYLPSPGNAESSNDTSIKIKLTHKIQSYLQNLSNTSKTGNTEKSNKWIHIDTAKNSNGKSNISALGNPADFPREGIQNNIKTLLLRENVTETHLVKLTRIINLMAKSILFQVGSNPQYDRKLVDSQIHNMTKKIWEFLKKRNSTEHKSQSKIHVKAHWSEWGNWSPCAKECKRRKFSTRSRTCFVSEDTYKACIGHSSEVKKCPCIPKPPPPKPTGPTTIYGEWTSWGKWSQCSVTCDLGNEQSYRKCKSAKREFRHEKTIIKCKGSHRKSRACIMAACGTTKAEYKLLQGSSTSLACKSKDDVVHKSVFWVSPLGKKYRPGRNPGRVSVTNDGQLHIKYAHLGDGGTYYCIIPITNGNIIGNARILVLTCQDDPCLNGGTCVEQKYEIITQPSSFVCECPSGFHGDFCEKEMKQLRAILIIIPVCGGLLMLTCIITMVAVRLKKKRQTSFDGTFKEWNGKDRVKPSSSKEHAQLKKKSSKESKEKQNRSVVSGDDSLQEIKEQDLEEVLSPAKSRKTNVSYKRQSARDPVHRNEFVAPIPGKYKAYPSSPEELRNWYTRPQSNAEYYNSPMDINVYSNLASVGATNNELLYGNIPQNYDETDIQKDYRYTPAMSVRAKNDGYERMDPPNTGASQLQSSNMGDFKLIHKSLSPSRNTTRRYPNYANIPVSDGQNTHYMFDEPILQERNMNNLNTELEKDCHHTDSFDKQSLGLNQSNAFQSPDDIMEPTNPQTGLFYQRFKPQIMYTPEERRFHYFLDFSQSGSESSEPRDGKDNHILQNKTDRTKQNRILSTKPMEIESQDAILQEEKGNAPAPLQKLTNDEDEMSRQNKDFHYLQSPDWNDTPMKDIDDFDDEIVFKTLESIEQESSTSRKRLDHHESRKRLDHHETRCKSVGYDTDDENSSQNGE